VSDFAESIEYSPEELKAMEDHHRHYVQCQEHWLNILGDALWDEDVPWESTVPRFQYEPVVLDAIADLLARAYYAGQRSATKTEVYWAPPKFTP